MGSLTVQKSCIIRDTGINTITISQAPHLDIKPDRMVSAPTNSRMPEKGISISAIGIPLAAASYTNPLENLDSEEYINIILNRIRPIRGTYFILLVLVGFEYMLSKLHKLKRLSWSVSCILWSFLLFDVK